MQKTFSHLDTDNNPSMVDVSGKAITKRTATARSIVVLSDEIMTNLQHGDIQTKKGPVFQTAIIAGVMAAKRTHELIPFCHPLGLEDVQVAIEAKGERAIIQTLAKVTGKTGVEMEALTAASVAALTIYDMCKAISHDIVIENIHLTEKTGGKSDFHRS